MITMLDQAAIFCFNSIFAVGWDTTQLEFKEYFLMKLHAKSEDTQILEKAKEILGKVDDPMNKEGVMSLDITSFLKRVSR